MEIQWITEAVPVNENIIFEVFDLDSYMELVKKYNLLHGEEKGKYKKGMDDFISKNGGPSLSSMQTNYKKLQEELTMNLEKDEYFDVLPVDLYAEKETIMDLLASLENENYIKRMYKKKKLKVSGELSTTTATKLMDTMRQGRSLLQSAQVSNMLSKPLIDFYAASAYAYASIVINSPLHKALDSLKGSHGHTYNHLRGTVEFGGSVPTGTFIDLLASIFCYQVVTDEVRFKCSAISSLDFIQKHEIRLSLIALLSTVPELREQVLRVDGACNIVHNLRIQSKVVKNKVTYVFEIGNGICRPDGEQLKRIFKVSEVGNVNGKYVITVPAEDVARISPTIYKDMRGELWYVEPLVEGVYLPEICLHFLIISALCNIMRYSPHEWNNILSNKLSSEFSLLISKYLRLFEIKYPMLLVQQFTNFWPVMRS